ncbi:CPBP family intramembrane glutamic endopeptidase [Agromyces mediolanus]|uniref:Abortive infection protein n=1 Tax=Agromyces mediolanus TaxID=41986 RepID=A0A918FHV3_AGRME|nr:CPBP family intramembrane glutamic endopeptidase [Agromyces mediolanus]GGR38606.1 abortive infection protein [Agromyces mediolanus]GLJ70753.1 abortive infection protein [Agromyces mediolanus]
MIVIGTLLVVQIGTISALAIAFPVPDGSPMSQVQEAIGDAAGILVIVLWVVLFERRAIARLGLHKPARGIGNLLVGIVAGLALVSIPVLFLLFTGAYVVVDTPAGTTSGFSALPMVMAMLALVVVQGGGEEVLFRGFLLQNQVHKVPAWLAVLLPAFVFTVVHQVLSKPLPFITIFAYAVFASLIVLRNNSLWGIMGLHAGWNWAMGYLYGIQVSGLPNKTETIVNLAPADDAPDWLTGGAFGTEGGLAAAVTIVLATGIAYLSLRKRARAWPDAPETPRAPAVAEQAGTTSATE